MRGWLSRFRKALGRSSLPKGEVPLRVLCYREDGEWVALALEMDLRGYGRTPEEAAAELRELVFAQITFALQKGELHLLYYPAERRFFQMFFENEFRKLRKAPSGDSGCEDVGTSHLEIAREAVAELDPAIYHQVNS